jgi:putative endonuclease
VKKNEIGKQGEVLARQFLEKQGYKIIETNYRCPLGEIDLIARHQSDLVFVEVKTRNSIAFSYPVEAVNYAKQRKIIQVSLYYIKEAKQRDINCRYDVVSVILSSTPDIQLIKGAFDSTAYR